MNELILVVDDEPKIVKLARDYLEQSGFRVMTADDGITALAVAHHERPDLIVLDLKLPGMDGLELLAAIRRQNMQAPVIVMTAFGTIEVAVQAMKSGAVDFLLKPFSLDHLMAVVQKALEVRALRDENRKLRE